MTPDVASALPLSPHSSSTRDRSQSIPGMRGRCAHGGAGKGWLGLGVQGPSGTPLGWAPPRAAGAVPGRLSKVSCSQGGLNHSGSSTPGSASSQEQHGLRAATATNVTHGDPTGTPHPHTHSWDHQHGAGVNTGSPGCSPWPCPQGQGPSKVVPSSLSPGWHPQGGIPRLWPQLVPRCDGHPPWSCPSSRPSLGWGNTMGHSRHIPRCSLSTPRQWGHVPIPGGTVGAGTPSRGLPGEGGGGLIPPGRSGSSLTFGMGRAGWARAVPVPFPAIPSSHGGLRGAAGTRGGGRGGQMGGGWQPRPAGLKIPRPPADLPARRRHPLQGIFLLPWQLVPGGRAGGAGKGLPRGSGVGWVPPWPSHAREGSRRAGGGQGLGAGMCGMIPAGWGLQEAPRADPGTRFPSGAAISLPRAGRLIPAPHASCCGHRDFLGMARLRFPLHLSILPSSLLEKAGTWNEDAPRQPRGASSASGTARSGSSRIRAPSSLPLQRLPEGPRRPPGQD